MKTSKKKSFLFSLFIVLFSTTSCLTLPLSRNFSKYTGTFFGNSSLLQRFGNYLITYFTFPIFLLAILVDIPLSVIHFWTGTQPIMKDPLISFNNGQTQKWFPGKTENEKWLAKISEDGSKMEVVRFEDGQGKDFYELAKDGTEMVKVGKYAFLTPQDVTPSNIF